jgi:hypothetical protein
MIEGIVIEVVQVDTHGGTKILKASPVYTSAVRDWHWAIMKEIQDSLS